MIIAAHDAVQAQSCARLSYDRHQCPEREVSAEILDFLEGTSKEYPSEFLAELKTLTNRANVALLPRDAKDIRDTSRLQIVSYISPPRDGGGRAPISDAASG